MKKGVLAILAALILATGATSGAGAATTFTDLVDFIGKRDDINGVDYEFVVVTKTFSYSHALTGLQNGRSLYMFTRMANTKKAALVIDHKDSLQRKVPVTGGVKLADLLV